jgi:1,4-dihydroxy-2-naphthoyl-CoA hydrolase
VMADGKVAMGLANQTSFMRPITEGTIHAVATVKHRGRTTWVWDVEITNDQGQLCVLTRMTVAVREGR